MEGEKKIFGEFGKYLHETQNNTHETSYLKYATMNIKYKYFRNSEHKTSI